MPHSPGHFFVFSMSLLFVFFFFWSTVATKVATWEDATLVIERCGPQGRFREERFIDADGKLQFKLLGLEEGHAVSWGRTFRRKDPT